MKEKEKREINNGGIPERFGSMSEEAVLFGCSWTLLRDFKDESNCPMQNKAPLLRSGTCILPASLYPRLFWKTSLVLSDKCYIFI